jgi:DNA-directed RNA polymerase subunit RPC12/RpoP
MHATLYGVRRSVIECRLMDISFNCPRCGQNLSVEEKGAGMLVNCPTCNEQIEIPRGNAPQEKVSASTTLQTPPPIPLPVVQQPVRTAVIKESSVVGIGCLLQGLGAVCLLVAGITFKSGFGPIIFGILGVWLLIYGSLIYAKLKASWLECSACGGKLSHGRVSVCPHCNASFAQK